MYVLSSRNLFIYIYHYIVVIRSYIAGLRDQLIEYKAAENRPVDDDPHAHYHGHEKCTAGKIVLIDCIICPYINIRGISSVVAENSQTYHSYTL